MKHEKDTIFIKPSIKEILFVTVLIICISKSVNTLSGLLIAISILFLIISLYDHVNYTAHKYLDTIETIKLDNIYNEVNTGDAVLFSTNIHDTVEGLYRMLSVSLFNEYWSHVGIVYKTEKDAYVMESTYNNNSEGPRMTPIKSLLDEYNGTIAILKCKKTINSEELLKSYNKHKKCKYKYIFKNSIFGYPKSFPKNETTLNCLDFSQALLLDTNVITKPKRVLCGNYGFISHNNYGKLLRVVY